MKKILTDSNDGTLVYNSRAVVSDIPVTTRGTSLILPQTIMARAKAVSALKRYGLCTQASTPTPSSPVDILCNTGAVYEGMLGEYTYDQLVPDEGNESTEVPPPMPFSKLFISQKNIFPTDWIEQGTITSSDGQASGAAATRVRTKDYIPAKPSQQYTISEQGATYVFVFYYKLDGTYISSAGSWKTAPYSFTTPANTAKVKFTFANSTGTTVNISPSDVSDIQLEEGTTATTYSQPPYRADIAPLLSNQAGTVYDEQDVLTGIITRRMGYVVLTGNETWSVEPGTTVFKLCISNCKAQTTLICTHFAPCDSSLYTSQMPDGTVKAHKTAENYIYFKYNAANSNTNTWQNWLTDLYNAGTPVIVVYEKTAAENEVMDRGVLSTFEGSNTVASSSFVDAKIDITYVTG